MVHLSIRLETEARTNFQGADSAASTLTISKIAVYPVGAEGVMSEHVADANTESYGAGPVDYEGGEPGNGTASAKTGCMGC